jgi:aminoglycoside 6'-N-acetyltransferase
VVELRGRRVVLRDVAREDAEALSAIHRTPEVSAWWGLPAAWFPFDDDARTTSLTILLDGAVAGYIQFSEELEPDNRFAWIDLFVDPRRHRQGIGTDAIETVVRHLVSGRGHHRITIDPATDNHAAIAAYERAGFRRVGVIEASWRDTLTGEWRDGLLMERVDREALRTHT